MRYSRLAVLALVLLWLPASAAAGVNFTVRSVQSGKWSDAATWMPKRVPGAGDLVQVRPGHRVTYDVVSDQAVRMIHVTGTLVFSRERSTRLDVGLIKVQPGEEATEDAFLCDHCPVDPKVQPGEEATEDAFLCDHTSARRPDTVAHFRNLALTGKTYRDLASPCAWVYRNFTQRRLETIATFHRPAHAGPFI